MWRQKTRVDELQGSAQQLLRRAQKEIPLRQDLTATQLLSMISALPKDPQTGLTTQPCLQVVLAGIRA